MNRAPTRTSLSIAAVVAAVCFVLDQGLNLFTRIALPFCPGPRSVHCARLAAGPVSLIWRRNPLVHFWIPLDPVLAGILALLGCALIVLYAAWTGRAGHMAAAGIGLLVGGALGNLSDRVISGGVNDTVWVGKVVFNLADVSLLLGMLLAIAIVVRGIATPLRTRSAPQSSPSL